MHNKRLSKTPSSINTNSQAAEQNPKLAYRPFGSQIQKASAAPVTQSTKEDVAFAEQKMEAFGLELQAKYGKITPEGQERLTVLQAKMDGLLNSRLEHAKRFSHNIANIPLRRPDIPIQAKLTIGEPGDKYEQEADETARQVVQRIHQPQSEKLQHESLPDEEDELQMKPEGNIQRESLPDEEEELQMKPMVQRVSDGGMAATQDLETSINQARGGGQPLAKNIREPMEQGFGADFSRVKVHTDTQSDQLNRAIQAKAFTTGQDVFFRQGAYEPESRGGQELIAHELTHVVQQNPKQVKPDKTMKPTTPNVIDPLAKEEDVIGQQALKSSLNDRSKKIIQRQAIKLEGENLTEQMKKRLDDAYTKFNNTVLSTSFLSQGQSNQVLIWGIKNTSDFKDYGSTTFYIGNSNQGYKADDYKQFTEIWQWVLDNPIPKDVSVRLVIAVNLSINKTMEQLFATLLHEWNVHAVKWKGLIEYIRSDKGNFGVAWIQGQGHERRGKGEHEAYANMSDEKIELMVNEINLTEKDKKVVIDILKKDRDRYDKNTGEI